MTKEFTITDAQDGSGDAILTFPDGFCEKMDWKVGDSLDLKVINGNLHIKKLENTKKCASGTMKSRKKTKNR